MKPSKRILFVLLTLGAVSMTFAIYLPIGMALAVLPRFAHENLGCSPTMVGVIIGTQYVATLLSRLVTGQIAATIGARPTVFVGMAGSLCGGGLLTVSVLFDSATPAIAVLLAARLLQGISESLVATGATLWGIGLVGARRATRVMSLNGVAAYSALGVGAPLGVLINEAGGLFLVAAATVLIAVLGLLLAFVLRRPPHRKSQPMKIRQVIWRVLPPGLGLAFGGIGHGVIASFIVLYHANRGWDGGALSLTVFAVFFIGVRLLLTGAIDRFGGYRVIAVAGLIEMLGLILLALAPMAALALVGSALVGGGFALFFPAFGAEAMARVPPSSRGSAISVYTVFVDISLGLSGPVAGLVIERSGYSSTFLLAALLPLAAAGMAWRAARRN